MNIFNINDNIIRRITAWWILIIISLIIVFFFLSSWSFVKVDAIVIWFFSCVAALYLSKKKIGILSEKSRIVPILAGLAFIMFSFVNIPLGWGNPPYSIGDFSLLLSGGSLVFFGYLGYRELIIPAGFPGIAVILFQMYELFIRNQMDILATPFIPPIILITAGFLGILGIPAQIHDNLISFTSKSGSPVNLVITPECTGIWSLGTFTISALIILITFPEARKIMGYLLILVGYIGTYVSNVGRVILISLIGYEYGSYNAIRAAHDYFAWLLFSVWMIIFWYIFLVKFLKLSLRKRDKTREKITH